MENCLEELYHESDMDHDVLLNKSDSCEGSESKNDDDSSNEDSSEDELNENELNEKDVVWSKYKSYVDLSPSDIEEMLFSSEHATYKFYYCYGKCHGFGVRKDIVERDMVGNIIMRQLLCNKAGLRAKKHFLREDRIKAHRPLSRTNCQARLRVRLDMKTGRWVVSCFQEVHNHKLCESKFVSLIRTYRGLSDADKAQVDCLHAHGVRTSHMMGFMMDQVKGHVQLAFNKKDVNNYVQRSRQAQIKDGDVLASLSYLQGKTDSDPLFYSRYTLFEDGQLNYLFWVDETCRTNYQAFGDVIAFDNTYKKNKYNKPLVIFSGKNHQSQTVLFGVAIVSDETIETYKWVLEAFVAIMLNKHPKSVITDGDLAIKEAIKQVFFFNCTHHICSWHLNKNANENVQNAKFLKDFEKALYGKFPPDRFEEIWKVMITKHNVEDNN